MARGEKGAKGHGHPGLVIAAVFAVACLASLLTVVAVDRDPEAPSVVAAAPAPFVGAYGVLTGLRWRDCVEGVPRPLLEATLRQRGYVARGTPRPAHMGEVPGLDAGCGLVLVHGTAAQPGSSCGQRDAVHALCAGESLSLGAREIGRTALGFVLPGFSAEDTPSLPLDTRLAHAEAASLLAAVGYVAGQTAARMEVTGAGEVALPLPPPPPTGCVALVATVTGAFEAVLVDHGGGTRAQSRAAGDGERRALVGLPHCAGPGGVGALRATLVTGAGLRVVYRAFTPPAGPGARGAAPPLRRLAASPAELVGAGQR